MATKSLRRATLGGVVAACALLALAACGGGSTGPVGPAGPPGPPGPNPPLLVDDFDPLPGLHVAITDVTGGTGPSGRFRAGDLPTVRFTARTTAGDDLDVSALDSGAIYVSGPTTNYQRVIAEQDDLVTASVYEGLGVWAYTFSTPIPAAYLPPINDSASFDADDGELQGLTLLSGTYTVGMELQKTYTSNGNPFMDAGTAVEDFLLGVSGVLAPRQVVQNDNCSVCHTELRAHDGTRKDVRLCVLCHTAGAEDDNTAGATPDRTIEFKVMVHEIHNGSHLPSVLGVSTDGSGNRLYPGMVGATPPEPLEFQGEPGEVADFSEVSFPVFPNFSIAMPRDLGYSALSSTDPDGSGPLLSAKSAEDQIRKGVTACLKCHGDPDKTLDGDGPLTAPSQGANHRTNPSRRACGACHDDIDWAKPYTANAQTMVAGLTDDTCASCHADFAVNQATPAYKTLSVYDAHIHPLNDPNVDPGVSSVLTGVTGGTIPGGNFQAGDTPTVTFTLKNEAGADIGVSTMDACSAYFVGPTINRQLIMPPAAANGIALTPFDFAGRLAAVSTTNKGTMSKVFLAGPAVAETLIVEFTSATTFTVTGTVSGPLGGGTLPSSPGTQASGSSLANFDLGSSLATGSATVAFSSPTAFTVTVLGVTVGTGSLPAATSASTRFTSPTFSFNITVGTTAFVAGNTFNIALFKPVAGNPVLFAIVGGRTAFSATAGARDRFYYEVVPDAPTYTLKLPMDLVFEFLADSTATAGQVLPAAGNLPVYFGRQVLNEATLTATTMTTTEAVARQGRSVAIAPLSGLANNDMVVVEPAAGLGLREYVQIQPVKSDNTTAGTGDTTVRIYFKTPLRYAHGSGITVTKVTLAMKQEGASNAYTLSPLTGVVTSNGPFTASTALVLSYRTDSHFGFRRHSGDALQAYHTPPPNDTAAIGQEQGDWTGLPYVDGTYTADLWLAKNIDLGLQNEVQTYRSTSRPGKWDFLFGGATVIVPHAIISSAANCNTCHDDLSFHGGGRRGADACLTCHSLSGGTNTLVGTAATASVPIEFRQMLHKIHMGADLTNGATYPFSNESSFPAMPGKVKQCVRCHGSDTWKEPAPRVNPFASVPVRIWGGGPCGSCHDSASAQAHIVANTSVSGFEACEVCHGPGKDFAVEKVHRPR